MIKKVKVDDVAWLSEDKSHIVSDEGVVVPFGSTLHFLNGFSIVEHPNKGVRNYNRSPEDFWTVRLEEQDGVAGLLLPEGEEEQYTRKLGVFPKKRTLVHRQSAFVPLSRLVNVSIAKVKALPDGYG